MRIALVLVMILVALAAWGCWKLRGMIHMPQGQPKRATRSIAEQEERALRNRLARHVEVLAGEIGERNVWSHDALERAADYIEAQFRQTALTVTTQSFEAAGRPVGNIAASLPGTSARSEGVVIGAHYDSIAGSPGANDNGSGVAAVLELARILSPHPFPRSVHFVAFVNEEPPFFQTPEMGSYRYAKEAHADGQRLVAMISIETIGYYSDEPGSQRYPFPFSAFYPDTGNFIAFVGSSRSADLVRRGIRLFRSYSPFPSEGVAAPASVPGVLWSDHWAFEQFGYPAIMVTDTAPYRYPFYHSANDTPDKVHPEAMARVTLALAEVVAELATPE